MQMSLMSGAVLWLQLLITVRRGASTVVNNASALSTSQIRSDLEEVQLLQANEAHVVGFSGTLELLRWQEEAFKVIQANVAQYDAVYVARLLAIFMTCIHDATAPYLDGTLPVYKNGLPEILPRQLRTSSNIIKAQARAAFVSLRNLIGPGQPGTQSIAELLQTYGIDPNDEHISKKDPVGIANLACGKVISERRDDGSNQYGNEPGTPQDAHPPFYADYSNYHPVNPVSNTVTDVSCDTVRNVRNWVPLRTPTESGGVFKQSFPTAFWGQVQPFALRTGFDLLPPAPPGIGTNREAEFIAAAEEVIDFEANATFEDRAAAEYWKDGLPLKLSPPGHWADIAAFICRNRKLTWQKCKGLLFLEANAVLDAGIAGWLAKRYYDAARPISTIQCVFAGRYKKVPSWLGPYKGNGYVHPSRWLPYQDQFGVTPNFAEYVSGHSVFSSAAAEVFKLYLKTDYAGDFSFVQKEGTSQYQPKSHVQPGLTDKPACTPSDKGYTPPRDILLQWQTWAEAAASAGITRLTGGVHFLFGDLEGRKMGRAAAQAVYARFLKLDTGC